MESDQRKVSSIGYTDDVNSFSVGATYVGRRLYNSLSDKISALRIIVGMVIRGKDLPGNPNNNQ
jgi:hypothetical protein